MNATEGGVMFEWLFRKKPVPAPVHGPAVVSRVKRNYAPDSKIAYHPDLIQRLENHHASLLKLFGLIKTQTEEGNLAGTHSSLQTFRQILTSHLLEENVKLYTYLTKCLCNDDDSKALMLSMKSQMGSIGSVVMRFLNGYINKGVTRDNKDQFLKELDEIGVALVQRIENEEKTLYTMYMPPQSFRI